MKNDPNLPDLYRDFFKTEVKGESPLAAPSSQSSLSSKVFQSIVPTTVSLPEVQFTITPQFDLVMLPNEAANSSKGKKTSSKKNSNPVQTKPKGGMKPILPKEVLPPVTEFQSLPPIQSEQTFEEDPLGIEEEDSTIGKFNFSSLHDSFVH